MWWTVPNLVTVVRLALVAPIVVLLVRGGPPLVAAALAAVFAATDWVDGFLARRLDQVSRLGERLDPVADRVGIGAIAVALAVAGAAPWWVLAVFPAVDVVVAGVYAVRGRGRRLAVARIGKVRTAAAMVGLFAVMAGLAPGLEPLLPVGQVTLAAGAALHVGAGAVYVRRMLRGPADPQRGPPRSGHCAKSPMRV